MVKVNLGVVDSLRFLVADLDYLDYFVYYQDNQSAFNGSKCLWLILFEKFRRADKTNCDQL